MTVEPSLDILAIHDAFAAKGLPIKQIVEHYHDCFHIYCGRSKVLISHWFNVDIHISNGACTKDITYRRNVGTHVWVKHKTRLHRNASFHRPPNIRDGDAVGTVRDVIIDALTALNVKP